MYLWMCFADLNEQLMDQPLHQRSGCVNAGNQLRNHLQPVVDLDALDAFSHDLVDLGPLPIVKPQRQESVGKVYTFHQLSLYVNAVIVQSGQLGLELN